MMASNPDWRGGSDAWKNGSGPGWSRPNTARVIQCRVFRFRGAFGQTELAADLRHCRHGALRRTGSFCVTLAANCLTARPPLTLFKKNFVVEKDGAHKAPWHQGRGLLPFMDFARVLA